MSRSHRYNSRPIPVLAFCYFALASFLASPITIHANSLPAWVTDPKTADSIYLYSLGMAQGQPTRQAAEQAAYRDAITRLLRDYRSDIDNPDQWRLKNAVMVPGAIHVQRRNGEYACWLQIMWPRLERDNLEEQLTRVDEVEQQWQRARSLAAEGRPAESRGLLEQLLAEQATEPVTILSPIEIQYQIARTWHHENRPVEARRAYERIIALAPDDPWSAEARKWLGQLPPPARAWPLNARFDGGPISLLAAIREGKEWRTYRELSRTLSQEWRAAGMATLDLAGNWPAEKIGEVIDFGGSLVQPRNSTESRVAIMVALDIDPSLRGTTTTAFGATIPAVCTRVSIRVVDTQDSQVLYEESFPVISGRRTSSNLAEYISHLVIEEYLLPHCPGIKSTNSLEAVSNNQLQQSENTVY